MEENDEQLHVERDGNVLLVTFENGPVNSLNQRGYQQLLTFFSTVAEREQGVRAIVLRSPGKHFCAGNDLGDFQTLTTTNAPIRMFIAREAFWAIYSCPIPVVVAIHGVTVGSGAVIAASGDVLVASDDAELGLPELRFGVMGGTKHLSRLLPGAVVRWMFLTGERISVKEAERYGGIHQIVPRDELDAAAVSAARKIAEHSPAALRFAKMSLVESDYLDLRAGYEREQEFTTRFSDHPDAIEAVTSFVEKRPASYGQMT